MLKQKTILLIRLTLLAIVKTVRMFCIIFMAVVLNGLLEIGFSSTKFDWGVLISSAGIFFLIYTEISLTEGNKGELNEGEK
jgi:hypothetical protein